MFHPNSASARARGVPLLALILASGATAQTMDDLPRLLESGRLADAAEVLRIEALQADDDPLWAAYAFNDACLLSTQAGDLDQARRDCAEAVRRQTSEGDPPGLARALNNRALLRQRIGELEQAENDYRAALDLNLAQGELEGATINRLNLAVVASAQGRFDRALRLTREAEQTARASTDEWAAGQILIARINQGALLERLEAHRAALDLYLDLLADIDQGAASAGHATLGHLEMNTGVVLRNLGDPLAALERYAAARRHFEQIGDIGALANVELNIGLVRFLDLGLREQGLESVESACRRADAAGDLVEAARCSSYLVELLAQLDRTEDARRALERARRREQRAGPPWLLDLGAARVARSEGDLQRAAALARRAIDQIVDSSAGTEDADLRAGYVEAQADAFELAIDLALEQAEQGVESARRTAYALALTLRERRLTQERLGSARSSSPRAMEQVVDALLESAPALPDPLIQRVDLHVVGDEVVRFHLAEGALRTRRFSDHGSFDRAARRVRRALSRGAVPAPADLDQLARLLEEIDLSGPMDLSAGGALATVPWDVVPVNRVLLGDLVDISYLPNVALALQPPAAGDLDLAWTAVAQAGGTAARGNPSDWVPDTAQLPPLPAAAREARRVRRALGADGLLLADIEATPEQVLRVLRRGVSVAHFATHTVIDERPGGGAALLLHDGVLGADELAAEKLRVQLAVLAACSTRQSSDGSGRFLGSLTGAWLMSGTDAVVATLWDVDDTTTASFMEQFYDLLGRGHPPRRALAETKRRLRTLEAWRHPSLWSAYVLVGDTGPVAPSTTAWLGSVAWAASLLALVLAATAGFARRRRP